jgi:hypothetical protein
MIAIALSVLQTTGETALIMAVGMNDAEVRMHACLNDL